MRLFTYSIGLLLLVTLCAACGVFNNKTASQAKSTPTPKQYPDGVNRVTIDELEALMKDGNVVVVDVRSQDAYDLGHIPGSKLIPANDVGNRAKELPTDKLIVTYCS